MRRSWSVSFVVVLCFMSGGLLSAQGRGGGRGGAGAARAAAARPTRNPLQGNKAAITKGGAKFRSRCSGCHGVDAKGYVAPDLTVLYQSGRTDEKVFSIIRNGVPGTDMPAADAFRAPDNDLWEIMSYIRSISVTAPAPAATGNAQNGERIFRANCQRCHQVNGRGGNLGPDLTRVGSGRTPRAITAKIRGTTDVIRDGFNPVTLVFKDGRRLQGVKKNEDEYSVQVMDLRERIQGYMKADLAEVIDEKATVMPVYNTDRLNESDFNDLLRYLAGLRADAAGSTKVDDSHP
jgi:cytochrome c oxidase cbb3-type subunit 3